MIRARGVRRQYEAGRMNGLETRYATALQERKAIGEIHSYRFESLKLRLADKTFYTPDFLVMLPSGELEFHEVKGFWEDDARVKIKVAAEQYPEFGFIAVMWDKRSGWKPEDFA